MAIAYSSFFASGLLAPPVTIYSKKDYPRHDNLASNDDEDMSMVAGTPNRGRGLGLSPGLSPAAPSSPMAIPDDSDIEFESHDRATTPTPESGSRSRGFSVTSGTSTTCGAIDRMMLSLETINTATNNHSCGMATSVTNNTRVSAGADVNSSSKNRDGPRSPSQPPNARRLRRRRSSLAGAVCPMSGIKSPSRSAGHALELQRHLLGSPLRSRSSSVSIAAAVTDAMTGGGAPNYGALGGNIFGPEQNKFIGRLRSGSTSSFRRRPIRKFSVQPPAPPPTAPLPALPPSLADTPSCSFVEPSIQSAPPMFNRVPLAQNSALSPNVDEAPLISNSGPGMFRKNRDRAYSINAYDRIDEEMKEN